jgi:phenylalanyl-tRNA synthetase beta subunit
LQQRQCLTFRFYHPTSTPSKLFEISDVVLKDTEAETGAINQRRLAAVHMGKTPGFETVQGLLDLVMKMLEVRRRPPWPCCSTRANTASYPKPDLSSHTHNAGALPPRWRSGWCPRILPPAFSRYKLDVLLVPHRYVNCHIMLMSAAFPQDPVMFGQLGAADVIFKGRRVGVIGVVHPEVLQNYELKKPVGEFAESQGAGV